jgi:hypothetical protein
MTADDVIAALGLPPDSRVDLRVSKKLLVEHGAPTPADKRQINDGIDELLWVAALKPDTIGVAEFQDDTRKYREIAVLSLRLRPDAKASRLVELIHRAVPYPVFLVTTQENEVAVSLACKRLAQSEAGRFVLEDAPVACSLNTNPAGVGWLPSLALALQPRVDMKALYDGWMACLEAFQAAQITGRLAPSADPAVQDARRQALADHVRLRRDIAAFRSQAEKEKQVSRRVEINLEMKRLEARLAAATANL